MASNSEAAIQDPQSLMLSVDIGTSQSAVCVLISSRDKKGNTITSMEEVSNWPGQPTMYEARIPSVLLYDARNKLVACGAEAMIRWHDLGPSPRGFAFIENFKTQLHGPSFIRSNRLPSKPLPSGLSIETVYKDFMAYLLQETLRYLQELSGSNVWGSLVPTARFILTNPNGWGVPQQIILQQAAVAAGLVTRDRLSSLFFVEEGEAAAIYCLMDQPMFASELQVGSKFIVCDAGGSTADISAYRVTNKKDGKFSLKELDHPSCLDAGGARVDNYCRKYFNNILHEAYETSAEINDYVAEGVNDFRNNAKRSFVISTAPCKVKLGDRKLQHSILPIKNGVFTIDNSEAAKWFQPSVGLIVESITPRFEGKDKIQCIITTGGFGESPYLKQALERHFKSQYNCPIVISKPWPCKPVAKGGLWVMMEGPAKVTIDRKKRSFGTMIVNLGRKLFGKSGL